ncbi:MAG: ABC transporter permease [Lachnospiraceae bacterium]|nr:ABC transporter permease [Lachnospiraceae bacterium]
MRPLSAAYYIKENKRRAAIIILLLFITTTMFLAGNYVSSVYYFWEKASEYSDSLCVVTALSTDEDFKEFAEFYEDLKKDGKLIVQPRSSRGMPGLSWICTLGFEMGSSSMVFDSPEDLKTAFEVLGIECDYSDVKDGTIIISSALAEQHNLKKGDIVDPSVSEGFPGSFRIGAVIEDDSYIVYYVLHSDGTPLRLNVISSEYRGQALRDHINEIRNGRKAEVGAPVRDSIKKQFEPFDLIFRAGMIMLSVILAVITGSVISGQFISRSYEFGVYRAIGISKGGILKKVALEMLLMDGIAILLGGVIIFLFTFLMNELHYIPSGKYLPYFSELGLEGFLISNILVVLPTILMNGRSMGRSDVTAF